MLRRWGGGNLCYHKKPVCRGEADGIFYCCLAFCLARKASISFLMSAGFEFLRR